MQSNNNFLIVFMTHKWGTRMQDMYNQFKNIHDTIVLADIESKNEYEMPEDTIYFDKKDFKLPMYQGYKIFINNYNPFFTIYDKLIKYDYVYMVEWDVEFFGPWKTLFNLTDSIQDDFIISTMYSNHPDYIKYQDTNYISSFIIKEDGSNLNKIIELSELDNVKYIYDIPNEFYSIGLHCFSRYSNRFIKFLYKEIPHYKDFFEIVTPTLALYNGYSVTNLRKSYPKLIGSFTGNNDVEISCKSTYKLTHPNRTTDYYTEWKNYINNYDEIMNMQFNIQEVESREEDNFDEILGSMYIDAEGMVMKHLIKWKLLHIMSDNKCSCDDTLSFLKKYDLIDSNIYENYLNISFNNLTITNDLLLYLTQIIGMCAGLNYNLILNIIEHKETCNKGLYYNFLISLANMSYRDIKYKDLGNTLISEINTTLNELIEIPEGVKLIKSKYDVLKSIDNYNIPNHIDEIIQNHNDEEEHISAYHNSFIEKYKDFLEYLGLSTLLNYKNIAL